MMTRLLPRIGHAMPLGVLLVAMAGCQEENTPPTATFDSPESGATLYPGAITFQGTVGDAEISATELTVSFDAGSAGSCDAVVAEDGTATCDIVFDAEGTFRVTLWAMDDIGQKASDEIELTVYDAPPSVTIVSPDPLAPPSLTDQDALTLVAAVSDPDDVTIACTWESSLDGVLGAITADPTTSECVLADVLLSGGTHAISVTARDTFGKEATVSYQQPVTPCTDYDSDGYFAECGVLDCNDGDATTHPGAVEVCNSRDTDCDGIVDNVDQDGDGYSSCFLPPDGDCDDANFLVHPYAEELCDGLDNDCDDTIDEGFDRDHDGYSSCADDCDDSDATINPSAAEVCDNVDNDCDGEIDEDLLLTLYYDMDHDGHGDPSLPPAEVCEVTAGLAETADDCDDGDATVYPGAEEVCNGVDDDCDGETDEGTTPLTFYQDSDGDGYGATNGPTEETCTPSPGYVLDASDCNDEDASVHPDATEVCNTIDDNCDGEVDEGVSLTYYPDEDGDGYGASDAQSGCEIPGGYVSNSDDCDDGSATVHPGAQEMCNGIDDDCNGTVDDQVESFTFYEDKDGDGYGSAGAVEDCSPPEGFVLEPGDCDDNDLNIYPGAEETCNGKDDDCDNSVDENVKTQYWKDNDGDGYGGDASSVDACQAPAGYVTSNTDCNDDNPAAHPGATEACDGIDTNCNGEVDEGFEPLSVFYLDSDGDGYGSNAPEDYTQACAAPPGYSDNNEDCNDNDGNIFPGAPELANGKDDDCDGHVDEGTQNVDDDGDGFAEVDNPGDCDDSDSSVYPGATEVMNGKDYNCDGMADEGSVCADDDGDGYVERDDPSTCPGYPDVYGDTIPGGSDCDDANGAVHPEAPELFNGQDESCDGTIDGTIPLGSQNVILTGDKINGQAGYSVAFLGDLNGDGLNDIGVGAPGRDNRGAVHLIFGKTSGWRSQALKAAGLTLEEDLAGANGGFSLSAADLDRDGYDDLAIGAPYRSSSASQGGTLYLLYGSASGWSGGLLSDISDAYADGLLDDTLMGYAISGGCDVDGDLDHVDDLAVGTPWTDAGYLLLLPGTNGTRYSGAIQPTDFAKVEGNSGLNVADVLGISVAMAGNVNGDEWCDVLVAGEGNTTGIQSRTEPGIVYLVPGYKNMAPGDILSPTELGAVALRGQSSSELVGYDTAGVGDVNGDGFDDYMIGRKARTEDNQGVAYLFFGGPTLPSGGFAQQVADAYFTTGESNACPCTVAGLGDIDNDGLDDIAIGMAHSNAGATDGGAVYVFYGDQYGWTGETRLEDADVRFFGSDGDLAGSSVAPAGDLNGDGFADFVIGAPGYDAEGQVDAGRVFVLFGFSRE